MSTGPVARGGPPAPGRPETSRRIDKLLMMERSLPQTTTRCGGRPRNARFWGPPSAGVRGGTGAGVLLPRAMIVPYLGDAAMGSPAAARPGPTFGAWTWAGADSWGSALPSRSPLPPPPAAARGEAPVPARLPPRRRPSRRPPWERSREHHRPGSSTTARRCHGTGRSPTGRLSWATPWACTGPTSPRTTTRPISSSTSVATTWSTAASRTSRSSRHGPGTPSPRGGTTSGWTTR